MPTGGVLAVAALAVISYVYVGRPIAHVAKKTGHEIAHLAKKTGHGACRLATLEKKCK